MELTTRSSLVCLLVLLTGCMTVHPKAVSITPVTETTLAPDSVGHVEQGALQVLPDSIGHVEEGAVQTTVNMPAIPPEVVHFREHALGHIEPEAFKVEAGAVQVPVNIDIPTEPIRDGMTNIGDAFAQMGLMIGEDFANRLELLGIRLEDRADARIKQIMAPIWIALGGLGFGVLIIAIALMLAVRRIARAIERDKEAEVKLEEAKLKRILAQNGNGHEG